MVFEGLQEGVIQNRDFRLINACNFEDIHNAFGVDIVVHQILHSAVEISGATTRCCFQDLLSDALMEDDFISELTAIINIIESQSNFYHHQVSSHRSCESDRQRIGSDKWELSGLTF